MWSFQNSSRRSSSNTVTPTGRPPTSACSWLSTASRADCTCLSPVMSRKMPASRVPPPLSTGVPLSSTAAWPPRRLINCNSSCSGSRRSMACCMASSSRRRSASDMISRSIGATVGDVPTIVDSSRNDGAGSRMVSVAGSNSQ